MTLLAYGMLLAIPLLILAVIDMKTFVLPNVLTFPLIAGGLLFSYFHADFQAALIGGVAGYAGFVALELFYRQIRGKEGLGRGDAKLLAAGGVWCGWFGLPFIILIASGAGLVHVLLQSVFRKTKTDEEHIPFGPFLAAGILLTWLALFVTS